MKFWTLVQFLREFKKGHFIFLDTSKGPQGEVFIPSWNMVGQGPRTITQLKGIEKGDNWKENKETCVWKLLKFLKEIKKYKGGTFSGNFKKKVANGKTMKRHVYKN